MTARDYEELCNSLSMTEIVRLQSMLSLALRQRFERKVALAFSDLVGSTPYFARFGDEAGRRLQQRHVDLIQQAIAGAGRIVDTAGDGAFLCFPAVNDAVAGLSRFMRLAAGDNLHREADHRLVVRVGIHYGSVLTDGVQVTGDAVNVCARVAASAEPNEIRLTREAFYACVDAMYRLMCRGLPATTLKGIDGEVELFALDWRDRAAFATHVRLENGNLLPLPDKEVIRFGRLKEADGLPANDVVLTCPDENLTKLISRWHFELRRGGDGFVIRAVGHAPTDVNGRQLKTGEEAPLRPGDSVRVSNVLTLHFQTSHAAAEDATILPI